MSTKTEVALGTSPLFDVEYFREALALFQNVPAPDYCARSKLVLSQPDPISKMKVSGGVRQLSMPPFIFAAEPEGILASTLYYLVALSEGVVMPQLQELIEICAAAGNKGPKSKKGSYEELHKARSHFGPAIGFLASYGDATVLPSAPRLSAAMKQFHADRVSGLRNAIAHYSFKLEVETDDTNNDPVFQAAAKQAGAAGTADFLTKFFERTCRMLHLSSALKLPLVPSPSKSRVRYEEQLGTVLSKNSRVRTFTDVRTVTTELERVGYSMMFAHVERGGELEAKGEIKIFACPCGDGAIVVLVAEKKATCPACGATHPV